MNKSNNSSNYKNNNNNDNDNGNKYDQTKTIITENLPKIQFIFVFFFYKYEIQYELAILWLLLLLCEYCLLGIFVAFYYLLYTSTAFPMRITKKKNPPSHLLSKKNIHTQTLQQLLAMINFLLIEIVDVLTEKHMQIIMKSQNSNNHVFFFFVSLYILRKICFSFVSLIIFRIIFM